MEGEGGWGGRAGMLDLSVGLEAHFSFGQVTTACKGRMEGGREGGGLKGIFGRRVSRSRHVYSQSTLESGVL